MVRNKKSKGSLLWTKNYIFMMAINLMVMSCYQLMNSAIPIYVQDSGEGGTAAAGLVGGAFTISAMVLRPAMGGLADKKGRRFLIVIGLLLLSICCGLCAVTTNVWMLFVLRLFQGVFFSAITTGSAAAISDIIPKDRLMEGIGYYGLSNTMATAVGPGISLFLIETAGYQVDFLAVFGAGLLGCAAAYMVSYPGYRNAAELEIFSEKEPVARHSSWLDRLVERTAVPMAVVMLFAALAQSSISTFLPTFAKAEEIDNVGMYYTVYAIMLFITRPTTGRLSDKVGANKVVLPGMVLIIVAFLFLSCATTLGHVLAVACIYGIGYGSVQPVLNALVVKFCPPDRRGIGNSTFHIAMDGGYGLGAIIWGALADITNSVASIFVGAAVSVVIAGALYFLLVFRKVSAKAAKAK